MIDLQTAVRESRVIVCVGPGGVGKTSTSAAIGIHAAYAGRRVIVLTIDPARRLANALGLPRIGNEERVIPDEAFDVLDIGPPKGRMSAMMLDIKRAWDEVVTRYHPDPVLREKLLHNRFYETLSTALAGSQEYMAMEKLYELTTRAEDPPDLIVLDTPPAASAVDFLEAPSRMLDALDNDATRWLLEPYTTKGRVTKKLFGSGSSFFIRTIGKLTGVELLQELAELLSCFNGMYEGFRDRARSVRSILADERTRFVVVSTPRPGPVADARSFHHRLVKDHIGVGGIVLNRAVVDPFHQQVGLPSALRAAVQAAGGTAALSERLIHAADAAHEEALAERAIAAAVARDIPGTPVSVVPELSHDVHDITSLHQLRRCLFSQREVP